MIKTICIALLLFAAFVAAGLVGLSCETLHNDLAFSTGAFITSFGTMSITVLRIWNAIT